MVGGGEEGEEVGRGGEGWVEGELIVVVVGGI